MLGVDLGRVEDCCWLYWKIKRHVSSGKGFYILKGSDQNNFLSNESFLIIAFLLILRIAFLLFLSLLNLFSQITLSVTV